MDKQVGPPRSFWVEHNPISDRRGPLLSRIHIMRLRVFLRLIRLALDRFRAIVKGPVLSPI
jgi:hypothetical protein